MVLLEELSLIQKLIHADYAMMLKINRDWHMPFFDTVALFIREATFWVPLYVFLLLFITINYGRKGFWWAVALIGLVALTDLFSSHVVKEVLYRPRPCRDELMAHKIRFLAKTCGMNGSFTSSHATNHFAIATFIYQTMKKTSSWWGIAFIWAGLISYAQVYVGVHYPFDVLGGALIGSLAGFVAARLFNHQTGLGLAS
ncbi:MAG TPA: phosphatase PAP2 family protein [Chitinophagaceae bacterium]|nr:phosphatase PAP2 family protein [Chitinophagaceae bacterium]